MQIASITTARQQKVYRKLLKHVRHISAYIKANEPRTDSSRILKMNYVWHHQLAKARRKEQRMLPLSRHVRL